MRFLALAARVGVGLALLLLAAAAYAADFAQLERTPEFIKTSHRLDRELKDYFHQRFPGNYDFTYLGSFRVLVHRDGLQRSLTLVPVTEISFATPDSLCSTARVKPVVVGAVRLSYWQAEPLLPPGDMLLAFDEQHLHWYDSEGLEMNSFAAAVTTLPAGATVDPALGSLAKSNKSLANVLPDGTLQLYLQLADKNGQPLKDAAGYQKLLITSTVPGLVTDDSSPDRELAKPAEDDKDKDKDKDKDEGSSAPSSYHHH